MRVVLDINVWLSAIFWKGEASKIVELAEKRIFEIAVSKDILLEIIQILNREVKFSKFMKEKEQKVEDLIRIILSISTLIYTKTKFDIIKEHPSDNMFLELAIDGKAEYIISYDKHLLNLIEFRGIKIVKPKEILKL